MRIAWLSILLDSPLRLLGGYALSLTRKTKRRIVLLVDAGLCALTAYVALILRVGAPPDLSLPSALLVAGSLALALPIFVAMGLYREIFSQTGVRAIISIARACFLYAIVFATLFSFLGVLRIPRTIGVLQPILLFVSVAGSRIVARYWLFGTESLRRLPRRRVIIYGAGSAGRQLAGAISQSADMTVVGYFDDDPTLFGSVLDGCRIYAPSDMAMAVQRLNADELLIAIPSAPKTRRKEIITAARRVPIRVRTLPSVTNIANCRVEMAHLRDVEVEDLLGREPVGPDREMMRRRIAGKVVLVTGAGGSIGGEICRQLLLLKPASLLLFEINEFGLYQIHAELIPKTAGEPGSTKVIPLLGSVNDEARFEEVVQTWQPEIIYHAAAYKHVPLVEHNPAEGVRTNVLGTFVVASVAARCGVRNVTLISTDKAVRPASVMGATKRVAELVCQAFNQSCQRTLYSIVRFGNVLDTSGSVVPLFRTQISAGGPVTLTDKRVTRYFMTASEAAELVLQASLIAKGGEVFLLDMGRPVRLLDLAVNMIELAGLTVRSSDSPGGDIEIVEIGLRVGEKLHEELLIGNGRSVTKHPRIFQANEAFIPLDLLLDKLALIPTLLATRRLAELMSLLKELVPEYQKPAVSSDCTALEQGRLNADAPIARTA